MWIYHRGRRGGAQRARRKSRKRRPSEGESGEPDPDHGISRSPQPVQKTNGLRNDMFLDFVRLPTIRERTRKKEKEGNKTTSEGESGAP